VGGERRALIALFRRFVQRLDRTLERQRLLVELRLAQDVPSRLVGQRFQGTAAAGERRPVACHQRGQQLLRVSQLLTHDLLRLPCLRRQRWNPPTEQGDQSQRGQPHT